MDGSVRAMYLQLHKKKARPPRKTRRSGLTVSKARQPSNGYMNASQLPGSGKPLWRQMDSREASRTS